MLGAVVVARIVWVFPAIYLPRWLVSRLGQADPPPAWPATLCCPGPGCAA